MCFALSLSLSFCLSLHLTLSHHLWIYIYIYICIYRLHSALIHLHTSIPIRKLQILCVYFVLLFRSFVFDLFLSLYSLIFTEKNPTNSTYFDFGRLP